MGSGAAQGPRNRCHTVLPRLFHDTVHRLPAACSLPHAVPCHDHDELRGEDRSAYAQPGAAADKATTAAAQEEASARWL